MKKILLVSAIISFIFSICSAEAEQIGFSLKLKQIFYGKKYTREMRPLQVKTIPASSACIPDKTEPCDVKK